MRKNGFTLIELLSVIVILAIIALIATPIILGIINDARKESQERSIELYASAVKNAIAAYQLNNTSALTSFDQLDIEYDGDVVCTTKELYEDGSIYLADCTVNGDAVEYTYGEQQVTQVYKPQYYGDWSFSGKIGETPVPSNPSSVPPKGKNYYLGYDVTNGIITSAYVCFVRNNTEYCLKGYSGLSFDTNRAVLAEAFGESACYYEDAKYVQSYYCFADDLYVRAYSHNNVYADVGDVKCSIEGSGLINGYPVGDGDFGCTES